MVSSPGPGVSSNPRREDPALLRGAARFTDDIDPEGTVHAAVRRSRYAHARIEAVDVEPARGLDDVLGAYGAVELAALGAPTAIEASTSLPGRETVPRPLMAGTVARYVGEPVAFVVAEDRRIAIEAAQAVDVTYERLPAATGPDEALDLELPSVTDSESTSVGWAGGPATVDWEIGDSDAVERRLAEAAHVVSCSLENQRLAPVPLEPRALLATYDGREESFDVTAATQTPHADRDRIADVIGVASDSIRVCAPSVGGGFGTKGLKPYPEEPLVLWAARHHGRPVKWIATRSEGLLTDHHARDVHATCRLGLDDRGRFQALRIDGKVGLGAYPFRAPSSCLKPALLSGAYVIPEIHCSAVGVLTNTTPLGSYRGAGRPEAIYVVERLVHRAANALGVDPAELRRQNFIESGSFPYETDTGAVYDSGDYGAALERALELIDYHRERAARAAARDEGRYVGIGMASYVESTGMGPSRPGYAKVEVRADGTIRAAIGTADQGQGHATTFAGLIADELGVAPDCVTVDEGDTANVAAGVGTFGSRSTPTTGGAVVTAAREVIDEARVYAATALEVATADVRYANGAFHPRGAPSRTISLSAIAERVERDPDSEGGLGSEAFNEQAAPAYAFGTHVAVVEIDPRTGGLEVLRYVAVDDCGTRVNPKLVEGQIHGGVGQGLGQALCEAVEYDDWGSLVTGSLQDYALPRAGDMPEIETGSTVTPSPRTPHGAKGIGEAGTIAAPPAVVNAAFDALGPAGVESLDMPLSAEQIWRAIRAAEED